MTPDNVHFLIAMGFFTLLVVAISVTSILNTRAGVAKAQARAREAYWRATQEVPAGEEPGEAGEGELTA